MENPFNRSKDQIVGPSNLDKEKESAERRLRILRHKGTEPISLEDIEIEKTPQFKEMFNMANNAILEKLRELDIQQPEPLEEKRIHILPKDYSELEMESNLGQYNSLKDRILIKEQRTPDFFRTLIHELLHAYSINKFSIRKHEDGAEALGQYRSGYALKDKRNEGQLILEQFNEAVIDLLAQEIAKEKSLELCKIIGFYESFADTMFMGIKDPYYYSIKLIKDLVEKTSELNSIPEEEIWIQMKKGLFTGEMMHLRLFEKTFGPKTLQVLASYGKNFSEIEEDPFDESGGEKGRIYKRYLSYLDATPEEREKIANKLLNDQI